MTETRKNVINKNTLMKHNKCEEEKKKQNH